MGAFDMLSDNDPRVIAHEEGKLRAKYEKSLCEYSIQELKDEIYRRKKQEKIDKSLEKKRKKLTKEEIKQREFRYQEYLKLKKEFDKL